MKYLENYFGMKNLGTCWYELSRKHVEMKCLEICWDVIFRKHVGMKYLQTCLNEMKYLENMLG